MSRQTNRELVNGLIDAVESLVKAEYAESDMVPWCKSKMDEKVADLMARLSESGTKDPT